MPGSIGVCHFRSILVNFQTIDATLAHEVQEIATSNPTNEIGPGQHGGLLAEHGKVLERSVHVAFQQDLNEVPIRQKT